MGIARWLLENEKINERFLSSPNLEEARKRGFAAYSNAPHLVVCDPDHPKDGLFLRYGDIDPSAGEKRGEDLVVLAPGSDKLSPAETATEAVLDDAATVKDYSGNAIRVKTAFRLLKEGLMEHSLEEYAGFCGVPKDKIEKAASDFSSHGTKAATTPYHGAGNYVCGVYASYAVAMLNALVGSVDMTGGSRPTPPL